MAASQPPTTNDKSTESAGPSTANGAQNGDKKVEHLGALEEDDEFEVSRRRHLETFEICCWGCGSLRNHRSCKAFVHVSTRFPKVTHWGQHMLRKIPANCLSPSRNSPQKVLLPTHPIPHPSDANPPLPDWPESSTTLAALTSANATGPAHGQAQDPSAQLWEDNWDDDDKESPFTQQLR